MDVHCTTCGEPWDVYHLRHDAIYETDLSHAEAKAWTGLSPQLKLLDRFKPAPEKFTDQVALYPLPGPSIGNSGLLLTAPIHTIIIAGDAALTAEHLLRGQVWEGCSDREQAMESLKDILELADIVIPGHDNVMISPQRLI